MKKTTFFLLVCFLALSLGGVPARAEQDNGYFRNMASDWGRGLKNILTFPAEIPLTIQEYHCSEGRAFVRHLAGFSDGLFRSICRLGSGAWDMAAGIIPGAQEGYPVEPETLF